MGSDARGIQIMDFIICRGCNQTTSDEFSAGENRVNFEGGDTWADYCYAAYVNQEWVRGCNYKNTPVHLKETIDRMIGG